MNRSARIDTAAALAIGLLVLLTRTAFRARHFLRDDSILFALAMADYDFLGGRPHAPGYPLYIALARAAAPLFPTPEVTLVALSIAASVAAVVLLFAFARAIANRRAALLSAGLFALAPVFFENGIHALTYTFDALVAVGVAWLAWRVRHDARPGPAAALAVVLAAAVGLRPSNALFLAPLAAWAVWPRDEGLHGTWLRVGAALPAGFVSTLAWLLPMLHFGGGLAAWRATTGLQSEAIFYYDVFEYGWPAFETHLADLAAYLRHEAWLVAATALLAALAWLARGPGVRRSATRPPWTFFAVWILPSLLFHLAFFSGLGGGPTGYVLVFLPALYLAFGLAADAAVSTIARLASDRRAAALVTGALVLAALPAAPFVVAWQPHLETAADRDEWGDAWQALRAEMPPNGTVLVAEGSWYFARWHFPDYVTYSHLYVLHPDAGWHLATMRSYAHRDAPPLYTTFLDGPRADDAHALPPDTHRIILFDHQLAGENGAPRAVRAEVAVHETTLSTGWRVLYLDATPDRPLVADYFYDFTTGEGPGADRYA